MKKTVIFVVVSLFVVLAVVAVLAGIKAKQIGKLMSMDFAMPPESISAAVAKEEKWQKSFSAIGTITAAQGVNVTTELAGTVKEIAFESGAVVAKDDLLLRLDTSLEEAQLRAMEAQLDLAKITMDRSRKLRGDNAISQSELDTAEAMHKQNIANADVIRASIAKKTIRAPFAGRLGIRMVNLGEFLDVGKPIVSLQSLSPVYADFSMPQQQLSALATGMVVRVTTDAYPDKRFEGQLSVINPDLDENTRSVRLRATFANADGLLRPGMFARAEVLLPAEQTVTVIPSTAVLSAPYGDSVYIVEEDSGTNAVVSTNGAKGLVVRQQFIRTGSVRGDFVTVEAGVKPGDKVASSGLFKLRNKMSVVEHNDLAPKPSETPKPADS